jgi:hypothetical protein
MPPSESFYSKGEYHPDDQNWTRAKVGEGVYGCEINIRGVAVRGLLRMSALRYGIGQLVIPVKSSRKQMESFNSKVFGDENSAESAWSKIGENFRSNKGDLRFNSSGGRGTWELLCERKEAKDEKWRRMNGPTESQKLRSVAGLAKHLSDVLEWQVRPLNKEEVK